MPLLSYFSHLEKRATSAFSHLRHPPSLQQLRQRPPLLLISVIKATLALCLLHVLTFTDRFANLNVHPTTFNGAVLVVVGGYPGGSMGKCFQAVILGTAGLGIGALVYAILGWLSDSPTGQGFVFAIWVYLAALVRFGGPTYISFYLYGVIFSFNGIYGGLLYGAFDKGFFLANFEAYAWGIAIALVVNVLVLPMTSEHELRRLLVTALEHVSALTHLTCKAYARELEEDEMEVRKVLIKTIRSDYLALTSRLSETSYEILYTRFSLHNYRSIISAVQGLQQALITASSALDLIDELDPEGRNHRHLMARAETARTFNAFRHGIDLVIAEIIDNLVGPVAAAVDLDEAPSSSATSMSAEERPVGDTAASTAAGGVEAQGPAFSSSSAIPTPPPAALHKAPNYSSSSTSPGNDSLHTSPTTPTANRQMLTIAARLKREVQNTEARHERIRRESNARRASGAGSRPGSLRGDETPPGGGGSGGRRHWARRLSGIGPRDENMSPTRARAASRGREREKEGAEGGRAESRSRPSAPSPLEGSTSPRESDETAVSEDGDGIDSNERDLEQALPGEESAAERRRNRSKPLDPEKAAEEGATDDDVVEVFRKAWDAFARAQQNALVSLIKDGALEVDDVLRIEAGMPSIKEMYADRLPKAWTSSLIAQTPLQRLRSHDPTVSQASIASSSPSSLDEVPCSEALTKSYSLLFGLGQLTEELGTLHDLVTSRTREKKRIRFFVLQMAVEMGRGWWKPKDGMNLQQALAILHGQEYKKKTKPWIHWLREVEKWFWTQRSLYAAKVAMGTTVYTVFALAPVLQQHVFLKIGQVSALITIIVAIAPTLGGTLSTWLLQISGTGAGALVGLIVLEIFKDIGGYHYNPYGIVALGAPWFAFSSYWFYKYPARYTQTLLFATGYGGMAIQEYLYNDNPLVREAYDTPPLRFGYTIASLVISMGISGIFQLLVFRQPARRRLRLQLADTMFALSAYNTLFQAFVNLVAPPDEAPAPPVEALARVQRELTKRENKIQSMILAHAPVFNFAQTEPQWWSPFKSKTLLKVMRSQQIILDRLRESRTAVGLRGFNPTIHHDFANVLFPYRLHSQRLARTLFFLSSTSLLAKTQLARDVPSSKPTWASFERDALVLSRRMSKLPRGEEELKRPGFLRYWFYLVSLGAVSSELEDLERDLGELFGDPDFSNPYIS